MIIMNSTNRRIGMSIRKSDVTILRNVVEKFGIDKKGSVDYDDVFKVSSELMSNGDVVLSNYIQALPPGEFEDLIVNTIYG